MRRSSRSKQAVNYNEDTLANEVEVKAESEKKSKALKTSKESGSKTTVVDEEMQPLPKRNKAGRLVFADHPEFRPNLTPKQVLQRGSFGGTYFRSIHSGATGLDYACHDVISEFPEDWFEGLDLATQVCSKIYDPKINKYDIRCGGGLDMWEGSGWIAQQDPYGWFMWYCRFYLGRRSSDDDRQIGRGNGVASNKGRFRNQLINTLSRSSLAFNDFSVSPVIRQTLQHWGYDLTEADCQAHVKSKGMALLPKAGAAVPPPTAKDKVFDPEDMKPLKATEVLKLRAAVARELKGVKIKFKGKASKEKDTEVTPAKTKNKKTPTKAKTKTSTKKKTPKKTPKAAPKKAAKSKSGTKRKAPAAAARSKKKPTKK